MSDGFSHWWDDDSGLVPTGSSGLPGPVPTTPLPASPPTPSRAAASGVSATAVPPPPLAAPNAVPLTTPSGSTTPPASGGTPVPDDKYEWLLPAGVFAGLAVVAWLTSFVTGWFLGGSITAALIGTGVLLVIFVSIPWIVVAAADRLSFFENGRKAASTMMGVSVLSGLHMTSAFQKLDFALSPYGWLSMVFGPCSMLFLAAASYKFGKCVIAVPVAASNGGDDGDGDDDGDDSDDGARMAPPKLNMLLAVLVILAMIPLSWTAAIFSALIITIALVAIIGGMSKKSWIIKLVAGLVILGIGVGVAVHFNAIDSLAGSDSKSSTQPKSGPPSPAASKVPDKSSPEYAVNHGKLQISECTLQGFSTAVADANAYEAFGGPGAVARAKFAIFYPTVGADGKKIGLLQAMTTIASKPDAGLSYQQIESGNPEPFDTAKYGGVYFAGFVIGEEQNDRTFWVCKIDSGDANGTRIVEKTSFSK